MDEAAFPAYAHRNPLISFLFWRRLHIVMKHFERRGRSLNALDFGCGSGVMLPFLASIADRVVAADVDFDPLHKMAAHVHLPENVEHLNVADASHDELAPSSFDVIIALDVLEHVSDLPKTLNQLAHLLTKSGILVVSGPTENWAYKLGRRLAGKEYTGNYHVRGMKEIYDAMKHTLDVSKLATLYPPFPLFEVYCGNVRS